MFHCLPQMAYQNLVYLANEASGPRWNRLWKSTDEFEFWTSTSVAINRPWRQAGRSSLKGQVKGLLQFVLTGFASGLHVKWSDSHKFYQPYIVSKYSATTTAKLLVGRLAGMLCGAIKWSKRMEALCEAVFSSWKCQWPYLSTGSEGRECIGQKFSCLGTALEYSLRRCRVEPLLETAVPDSCTSIEISLKRSI